jgi:hypothetical protein
MVEKVIINRPTVGKPIDWPEGSYPLYFPASASAYPIMFSDSRIMPDATMEIITFMKLQGFSIMEAPNGMVSYSGDIYIMNDGLRWMSSSVIKTNIL